MHWQSLHPGNLRRAAEERREVTAAASATATAPAPAAGCPAAAGGAAGHGGPLPAVAVGGTFDHFHKGHEALLLKAFEIGRRVVIGVTSDGFAKREGKEGIQPLSERIGQVQKFLTKRGLAGRSDLVVLEDPYGPTITDRGIAGIVITPETAARAAEINRIRSSRAMPPLSICTIGYVLAYDRRPISSSRIRSGEIDPEGGQGGLAKSDKGR